MLVYLLDSNKFLELIMPEKVYSSVAAADVTEVEAIIAPVKEPPVAVALLGAEADLKKDGDVISGLLIVKGGAFENADLPEVIVEEVEAGEGEEEVVESGLIMNLLVSLLLWKWRNKYWINTCHT